MQRETSSSEQDSARGRGSVLKVAYIAEGDLSERAETWLEKLAPYIRHSFGVERLGPRPGLLVMDMQRLFLEEGAGIDLPAARAILPRINDLIDVFRDRRLPLVFTRHVDRAPGPDRAGGRTTPMMRWWSRAVVGPEDPLAGFAPALNRRPTDTVVEKSAYSAFHGTRLSSLLDRLDATSLIVTGVMTHLCCDATARDAFMRGFEVILPVDGTATLNEELHLSAFRGLVHGFAIPARMEAVRVGVISRGGAGT